MIMQFNQNMRTIVDFQVGWKLLEAIPYLPHREQKIEVVQQVFDKMQSDTVRFKDSMSGIDYSRIYPDPFPGMDSQEIYSRVQYSFTPFVTFAVYCNVLMHEYKLFNIPENTSGLYDDFPFALEYVDSSVITLISGRIDKSIQEQAKDRAVERASNSLTNTFI